MMNVSIDLCREFLKAAENGETEKVRQLLTREGLDVRYTERNAWWGGPKTALILACQSAHVETVRVILEYGGETQEELEGAFWAARGGCIELLKILLEKGANPAADDNWAIRFAASHGRLDLVELLLRDERVDPASYSNFAVRLAASNGYCDVVECLLRDPRCDPSAQTNFAVRKAAREGHHEMVQLLLRDRRVDPAADDNDAIRFASEFGHVEVVELLLRDNRVDPTAQGNFAVRFAAQNGHVAVLKLLLRDPRVNGTCAIFGAHSHCVPILFEDKSCGIKVNRAMFEQHHMLKVLAFDKLMRERTERICAASWCMKQIGEGWGDMREPTEKRMQKAPLDWESK